MRCLLEFSTGFLDWWASELIQLLQSLIRSRIFSKNAVFKAHIEGDEMTLVQQRRRGPELIGRLSINAASNWTGSEISTIETVRTALEAGSAFRGKQLVDLHVPETRALRYTVTLATTNRENFRELVSRSIDEYTPFAASDLYFDLYPAAKSKDPNTTKVAVTAIPRVELDPFLGLLRSLSLGPESIRLGSRTGGAATAFAIADKHEVIGRTWTAKHVALASLAGIALAASIVTALPVLDRDDGLAASNVELVEARLAAREEEALNSRLEQFAGLSASVVETKRQGTTFIEVLDEITRLLPDQTWLDRISWTEDGVQISGRSIDAPSLIGLIEGSQLITGVKFAAPVVFDPKLQRDRFRITAKMVGG